MSPHEPQEPGDTVTIPSSSDVSSDRLALLREAASRTALTAVFHTTRVGDGAGCRAVVIDTEEPLARERSVIVVSPTFTASSVALEAGQAGDGSRLTAVRTCAHRGS